jgi:hypothetical protein
MLREFRSRKIGFDGYQSSVLNPHINGYLKWMTERGYSRVTLHGYLGHIHLSERSDLRLASAADTFSRHAIPLGHVPSNAAD